MSAVITTITGLQNLPNLQSFDADYNGLVTVDFSGLTSLTTVDVSDCDIPSGENAGSPSLTSVNVTGCTSITELRVDDSNFSANNISSIVGLSDLTSLNLLDVDGCEFSGSINLSGLPALDFLDLNGNGNLTEVIITGSQPINDFNGNNCNFSQTAIDNILVTLSENGTSSGEVDMNGDGMGIASLETGVPAIRTLSANGWGIYVNSYSSTFIVTNTYASASEACTDVGNSTYGYNAYTYDGVALETGSYAYSDSLLVTTASNGWFGYNDTGDVYLVSGSGLIVSRSSCV